MAQLTIYLDTETLRKIEKSASIQKKSISEWVREKLTGSMNTSWPEGYAELFGTLKASNFSRPAQGELKDDEREVL